MSTTRLASLASALGWNRKETALQVGCHPSHASRMLSGFQCETKTQALLLDRIAREHGLLHLTSDSFVAGGSPSLDPGPDAPAASPPGGGGKPVSGAQS